MLLKIKTVSYKKTIRYEKNFRHNCSSQEDIQIYFRILFDRRCSFRLNCKKRYEKWRILFCTKFMRDAKKMSGKKIVRFKKMCKSASDYFIKRVISFHLFIKNIFMIIENIIFTSKYTKTEKMLGRKIIYFKKIYNFRRCFDIDVFDHLFEWLLSMSIFSF